MSDKTYAVGYGRPPRHHQFKAGQSGNPSGKRKGARSLKSDLERELSEEVRVTENGKVLRLSKQQLVVKALVTRAAKGDTRAISKLIDVVNLLFGFAPDQEGDAEPLSAEDAEIMEAAIARATGRQSGGGHGEG